MNQKDLSEDVELLMWVKYLSESENLSLKYLSKRLSEWVNEDVQNSDCKDIVAEDISQSDWIDAVPLAYCLLHSKNLVLEKLAKAFFVALDVITYEMTEIRNNWNAQNKDQPANETFVHWKDLYEDASPF